MDDLRNSLTADPARHTEALHPLLGPQFQHSGNIGIMENQMETTIVYWGFIGIMEKKMETAIF